MEDTPQDNPYIVVLDPEEFDELLAEYENYVEWCGKSMTRKQQALARRVLEKLHEADATHVCVDEIDEVETTPNIEGKE